MNVIVETNERVPALSPIVTPLPFYQRRGARRQLAVLVLAVVAMIAGVRQWQSLVLSLPNAAARAPHAERAAPPPRVELVVLDIDTVDDLAAAPSIDPEPCL